MRVVKFYYFLFLLSLSLSLDVNALTEEQLAVTAAEGPEKNATVLSTEEMVQSSDESKPSDQLVEVVVESQGHENVGERKARQFGFPGFGYRPFYGGPYYGGGFGGGYGGGFGGGGFQRTRVVTRTRVVNRVRGGGFYGNGFYG